MFNQNYCKKRVLKNSTKLIFMLMSPKQMIFSNFKISEQILKCEIIIFFVEILK